MIPYSRRMNDTEPSIIREMLKLSLDPSYISFAGGDPDPELFPFSELLNIKDNCYIDDDRNILQYGISEGNDNLKAELIKFLSKIDLTPKSESLLITTGSQQGLDMTGKLFLDEGDKIIVERPSYMGAINAFKQYEPAIESVEVDNDGIVISSLIKLLEGGFVPKFLYTIPDFQNPTGATMSHSRRKKLLELASEYDFLIIEDSPYYFLRYEGENIPTLKSMDREDRVIYLGSFSKIVCPALRVGWIYAREEIIDRYLIVKQVADIHTNEIGQLQLANFLNKVDMNEYLNKLTKSYKEKKDAMVSSLEEFMPKTIQWNSPSGGLFLWLNLPEGWDSYKVMDLCIKEKVAIIPGSNFFTSNPQDNTIRLSFSTMTPELIHEGVKRIENAINNY